MILSEHVKATLYCLVFETPSPETVVFIQAGTKVAAIRKAMDALICLRDVGLGDVTLTHVASFREMVEQGQSDVESFRIFENGWRGEHNEEWVRNPLFFSNDKTLLAAWAALMLDLASEQAETTLKRMR